MFRISKDCHHFQESAFINDEFIRVECQSSNETIYKDYFSFVPRKLNVEERCRQKSREFSSTNEKKKLSVLIVGIDSVSRLNLHRSMPQTIAFLDKIGAIELLGFNKVADNTFPNLIPVLSGLTGKELEKLCRKNHKKPFDNCPLLWKNFAAKGYRTIFAEDACQMSIFNYLKPGFRYEKKKKRFVPTSSSIL